MYKISFQFHSLTNVLVKAPQPNPESTTKYFIERVCHLCFGEGEFSFAIGMSVKAGQWLGGRDGVYTGVLSKKENTEVKLRG